MASEQRGETDSLPKKIVKMTVIYILATLLALGLWTIRVRAENIIMVYLISVIILMIEIHQFLWGGIYTVICILSFNFFFTAPRYTLRVNDPNYIVTMVIFLIVSVITGLLVSKLREQVEVSQRNENRMKALFEISCGYLKLSGLDNIVYYVLKSLFQAAGERCVVYLAKSPGELGKPYFIKSHFDENMVDNNTPAVWCFINNTVCGAGTGFFSDSRWVYMPVKNRESCIGGIGIYTDGKEVDSNHMVFVNTVMSEMVMAVEKENIELERSRVELEGQRGKFLDALNHSLQCNFIRPFTSNMEEFKNVIAGCREEDRQRNRLSELYLRFRTLYNRTVNTIQMYNIEFGEVYAEREKTDFQKLVDEALACYEECAGERIVWLRRPDGELPVRVDAGQMKQVISNILNNALVYTPENTKIYISLTKEQGKGKLEISDSGSGITPQLLQKSMSDEEKQENILGCGLIAASEIVEANGGRMIIRSSQYGGTLFMILLEEAEPD